MKTTEKKLPKKPNLLIILTDQERQVMHFPEGWAKENLPAMERLKANGITFNNAFCNTCMCSSSRATLFTGLYPAQHNVTLTLTQDQTYSSLEPQLLASTQNMARMLAAGGYDVTYYGKWHLSKDAGGGFENLATSDLAYYGFDGWVPPDAGEDADLDHLGGGRVNRDLGYLRSAIAFLQNKQLYPTETPWALVVSLVNPHDVLAYPGKLLDELTQQWKEDYNRAYFDGDIALPATWDEDLRKNLKPTVQQILVPYLDSGLGFLVNEKMRLNYLNFYGNLMQHIDQFIGTLLDVLQIQYDTPNAKSLADDTIVIRTADHGEMGLTHGGMRQKMFNCYEETIHVPLVISNPILFPKGVETDALISLLDLMPTLNALLNLKNPLKYTFKGADMSQVVLHPQKAKEPQDAILFTFDDYNAGNAGKSNPMRNMANRIKAVREKRWKYATYNFEQLPAPYDPPKHTPDQEFEMYDLANDPLELENLGNPKHPKYNDPSVKKERERLQLKLAELIERKLN